MLTKQIFSVKLFGSVALAHLVVNLRVDYEAVRVGISQGIAALASLKLVATEATDVKDILTRCDALESQKGVPEFGTRP